MNRICQLGLVIAVYVVLVGIIFTIDVSASLEGWLLTGAVAVALVIRATAQQKNAGNDFTEALLGVVV